MKRTRIGVLIVLGLLSCNQKNEETIAQITELLSENLIMADVTNAVALVESVPNLPIEFMVNEMANMEKTVIVEEIMTPMEPEIIIDVPRLRQEYTPPIPQNRSSLYVVQRESYIKVGNDMPALNVSYNNSQKITVVVFPIPNAVMVDIYLYAIPEYSPLVRNYNTLIGFAQQIELVQGQAQFTKYWRARRSDGRMMNRGAYNIYVEYHYRNSRGQILQTTGRFWGGSHRSWKVYAS
ncbi:MAG: hypothetical protein ACRC0X_10370 [Brevinema sp.]